MLMLVTVVVVVVLRFFELKYKKPLVNTAGYDIDTLRCITKNESEKMNVFLYCANVCIVLR
jgi:hypothetical protein